MPQAIPVNELSAGVEPEPEEVVSTPPDEQLTAWRRHARRVATVLNELAPDLPTTWNVLAASQRANNVGAYITSQLSEILSEYPTIRSVETHLSRHDDDQQMWVHIVVHTTNSGQHYMVKEPLRGFPSESLLGKILVFT